MKKLLFFIFLTSSLKVISQNINIEIGNMYCPTNTGVPNNFIDKSIFRNRFYHLDFEFKHRRRLIYNLGYTFYIPQTGIKLKQIQDEYPILSKNSLLFSHHISLGAGYTFYEKKKWSISSFLNLDGRINFGDIGIHGLVHQSNDNFFDVTLISDSGFHIVPNIKTKISYQLNRNFQLYAALGYMYSNNKSVELSYKIYDKLTEVYSGTGFFTGTNWNYGIGISVNPKMFNK
jgi:hypothetical protein